MGTSSDFTGGRGGPWTGYKRAASSFAKHGGRDRANRVLARQIGTLGGARGAAGSAAAGARAARLLATFLTGAAGPAAPGQPGRLDFAAFGLQDLVGADRYEALEAIVDAIAGEGGSLEAQAARAAVLDVLGDIVLNEDVDLADIRLDADEVKDLLAKFLAFYLYNRAAPIIEERLSRLNDPTLAAQRDQEIRDVVAAVVDLGLAGLDPMAVDWQGQAGEHEVERLLGEIYKLIEAMDE